MLVALAILVLRRTRPDLKRAFHCPGVPVAPVLAAVTARRTRPDRSDPRQSSHDHDRRREAELADVADTAIAQVAEELGERPSMRRTGQVMKAATAIAAVKDRL
jgi:hypothetical protein